MRPLISIVYFQGHSGYTQHIMSIGAPKVACIECGGNGVPHKTTYFTILIDDLLRPVLSPGPVTRFFSRVFRLLEERLTPRILRALVAIGLAKKQEHPDDETLLLAKVLWEEADVRGITMWEFRLFSLARNIFVATLPSGKSIAFEGIPQPPSGVERVSWMDDKARLKKHFQSQRIPVARGGDASSIANARALYKSLVPPVIIKPHAGSGSRHTTLHIDTPEKLDRAFSISKQVSPRAIVEEELVGSVYRATVVNGVFVAALRRDPPHVIGDSVHSIRELMDIANKHPARSGPYFSQLRVLEETERELAWQGYTLESIPEKGERVLLHQKVNWSLGGTTCDVTDKVHAKNRELFEQATKELKAPIAGIDFIIEDISEPWQTQDRCGILECNSMPFFDNHHLPFEGKVQNVAAKIWDMVEGVSVPK